VAQAAQVHYSTVSKALRGRGRIPAATRDRIQQIAGAIGYRQDSVHAGSRGPTEPMPRIASRTTIVFLTNRPSTDEPGSGVFVRQFAEGVRHQAELMGCACDLLAVGDENLILLTLNSSSIPPGRMASSSGFRSSVAAFGAGMVALHRGEDRFAFMLPEATLVANDQLQIAPDGFHHACVWVIAGSAWR